MLDHKADRGRIFREVATRSTPGHRALERTVMRSTALRNGIDAEVSRFHGSMPGYEPTPLLELDDLGRELGLDRLWVKDESSRLGLPAFKILGASWAAYRMLCDRLGISNGALPPSPEALAALMADRPPCTFVAATDGNHGRAVARAAKLYGCRAHILVPAGTAAARIEAIEGEGATVEQFDGTYDEAVAAAEGRADANTLVLPDTATTADETVPRWVAEGYSTILREIDVELEARGEDGPDLIFVQIGVGALASAVVSHYRSDEEGDHPCIIGVEPVGAACVLETAAAGKIVVVPGPHTSVMAGLNAGIPSLTALPILLAGMDAFCAISDEAAWHAVRTLARYGIPAGETGAAGLAGLLSVKRDFPDLCDGALERSRRALVILTEGVTDPVTYDQALRR